MTRSFQLVLVLVLGSCAVMNCAQSAAENKFFHFEKTNCTFPKLAGQWTVERWKPNACLRKGPTYTGTFEFTRLDPRGEQIEQYRMEGKLKSESGREVRILAFLHWTNFNKVLYGVYLQNELFVGQLGYKLEAREPNTLEGYYTITLFGTKGRDRLTRVEFSST